MIKLDERDIKILAILQKEGRITKTELARRVHLSPAPCWARVGRLEQAGIIEGYGARICADALGQRAVIFMQVELGAHRSSDFSCFEEYVQSVPEIVECWAVGGGVDYILKFECSDINAYQDCVDLMLLRDVGLKRYVTYVVTKPVKSIPTPTIPQ